MKTSNAGARDIQDLALSDGRRVWQQVAELVNEWGAELVGERGLSSVGAVVGATYPRAVGEARRLMPQAVLLLPGIGAQGATPADVARAFTSGPAERARDRLARGHLRLPRRRSDWRDAAAAEAARLRAEVWASRAGDARRGRLARYAAPAAFLARRDGRDPAGPRRPRNGDTTPPPADRRDDTADDDPASRHDRGDDGPAGAEFYEIQGGDTLAVVAEQYGTTVERSGGSQPGRRPRRADDWPAHTRQVESAPP